MANQTYKHHRINPVTGEEEWFFPMEITDPSIREAARAAGLEIGKTRLGYRVFEAVMVPCRRMESQNGKDVYADTSAEEQHKLYLELIKEELNSQAQAKTDGRCEIPDGKGGMKRCPLRVSNPNYVEGSDLPKTIAVKCEGCQWEELKKAHTVIQISALDQEGDDGDEIPYEPAAPSEGFAADRYIELANRFVEFVEQRDPRLVPLARQRVMEFSITEAARRLKDAKSTSISWNNKLKEMVVEFLDNEVDF